MRALLLAAVGWLLLAGASTAQTQATGINGGYMYFPYGPPNQLNVTQLLVSWEDLTGYFVPPFAEDDPASVGDGQYQAYDAIISFPGGSIKRIYVYSTDQDYYAFEAVMVGTDGSLWVGRNWCCFPADGQIHQREVTFAADWNEIWLTIDGNTYAYGSNWDSGNLPPASSPAAWEINWLAGPTAFFIDSFAQASNPNFDPNNTVVQGTEVNMLYVDGYSDVSNFNEDGTQICVEANGYPVDLSANYNGVCGSLSVGSVTSVAGAGSGFYNADWP